MKINTKIALGVVAVVVVAVALLSSNTRFFQGALKQNNVVKKANPNETKILQLSPPSIIPPSIIPVRSCNISSEVNILPAISPEDPSGLASYSGFNFLGRFYISTGNCQLDIRTLDFNYYASSVYVAYLNVRPIGTSTVPIGFLEYGQREAGTCVTNHSILENTGANRMIIDPYNSREIVVSGMTFVTGIPGAGANPTVRVDLTGINGTPLMPVGGRIVSFERRDVDPNLVTMPRDCYPSTP